MEKLNIEQEKILDLIEQKQFDQLSNEELNICLKHYDQDELRLLFKVKTVEKNFAHIHEPAPLLLEESEKKTVVIPLYQTLLALAGSVVVCWFIFKEKAPSVEYVTKEVIHRDTIVQERVQYDTVTLTVEKKFYISVNQQAIVENTNSIPENLIPYESIPVDLSTMNLENKGSSFDEDITSILIQPK